MSNATMDDLLDAVFTNVAGRADVAAALAEGESGAEREAYNALSTADAHLVARVADRHLSGHVVWAAGLGWLRWDGRRWDRTPDPSITDDVRRALLAEHAADSQQAAAELAAAQTAARALDDPQKTTDAMSAAEKAHRQRLTALGSYLTATRVRNIMMLIKGILVVRAEDMDNHPYLLNVGNGVVDLRTGALVPHDPRLMMTKITMVDYRPGAEHADWSTAVTALEPNVRDWMQTRLGQAATGFTPSDDVMPIAQANGNNGKSTLFAGIRYALGEHTLPVPARALLGNPGDHPTELTEFKGARFAILEETPEARNLDVQRLKALIGTPTMTARKIAQDTITWKSSHSLFIATNHLPKVAETDYGTWRRLALVPFPFTYAKQGQAGDAREDQTLRQRVENGRDGQHEAALAWIVAGAVRWAEGGEVLPPPPAAVAEATEAWRGQADNIGQYLSEHVEVDPGWAVKASDLYDGFTAWSEANGYQRVNVQTFRARLSSNPLVTERGVQVPAGTARLGGRRLSTMSGGEVRDGGPGRYVLGLRFIKQ